MKPICLSLLMAAIFAAPLFAENALSLDKGADQAAVLQQRVGQVVELRLRSGEKIGGKVQSVGEHLVHLSALTGMEFYEATVAIDAIAAVVVRSPAK